MSLGRPKLAAIVRNPSPNLELGERTHIERQPIDAKKALLQHQAYVRALLSAGVRLLCRVPEKPDCPDGVFVEDAAVVLDEIGIVANPGALSRQAETADVAFMVQHHRKGIARIVPPGTLDGGDVMQIGKKLYVGLSSRTNLQGFRQLQTVVRHLGYDVLPLEVESCLHLKTGCSHLGNNVVLVDKSKIDPHQLGDVDVIETDPSESFAANALPVRDKLIYPSSFPKTAEVLARRGFNVVPVDISELQKAEAGVTCISIVFPSALF